MFERALISYAILTVGFTGISIAMMANGSDYPGNPAWPIVTTARNIFVVPLLVVAALAGLAALLAAIIELRAKDKNKPEEERAMEPIYTVREADRKAEEAKARLERDEEERRIAQAREQEQMEAKRQRDELKRQAEEKREKRSAEEATRSGLDDFL